MSVEQARSVPEQDVTSQSILSISYSPWAMEIFFGSKSYSFQPPFLPTITVSLEAFYKTTHYQAQILTYHKFLYFRDDVSIPLNSTRASVDESTDETSQYLAVDWKRSSPSAVVVLR